MKLLSTQFAPIADDSIIVKLANKKYIVYQTPSTEKDSWIVKKISPFPLGNIYFLKKDITNNLKKITDKRRLFLALYNNLWKENYQSKQLTANCILFIKKFNAFYELRFSKDNNQKLIKILKHSKTTQVDK